ncbi:endo alpha-1,4 polygalactosaminidase, partial [Amycolatopsis sp. SID8362]|uniref:endo alpha-1,4 polygalactosaminidase n=1 Tax=Amycolatopsis sp. SID8362 TaxID=2690346 RepID=UPI00136828E6
PAVSAAPRAPGRWQPAPGTTWQWQLSGKLDTSVDVAVYDIDGVDTEAGVVAGLHAAGRKVVCYVNVGAAEDFRPDAAAFPPEVKGKSDGWDGERWLDIRRRDTLRPIMAARFGQCRDKGFDAIEGDNVDGYDEDTGFPLTAADQLAYNRMLAGMAHELGLSIALKNDLGQVRDLVADFDFSVDEECAELGGCPLLTPFVEAGKAVFHVEYNLEPARFCAETTALGFSSMRKNRALDAPRWPCTP